MSQTGLANGRHHWSKRRNWRALAEKISGWRNKAGSYRPPQGSPRRTGAPVNRDYKVSTEVFPADLADSNAPENILLSQKEKASRSIC